MLRYRFDGSGADVGMVRMAVTILVSPLDHDPADTTVSVTPRVDLSCENPLQPAGSLSKFNASQTLGSWAIYDLAFKLAPIPGLGCQLAKYAQLEFNAPPDISMRIAAVRISGIGTPSRPLESISGLQDTPQEDGGILTNMLFVYIAVGVGALIVLFLLVLVWYCLGRPCCCGGSQQVRSHVSSPALLVCRPGHAAFVCPPFIDFCKYCCARGLHGPAVHSMRLRAHREDAKPRL